jgi:hypothetical protein
VTERDDLPRHQASRLSARGFGIAFLVLTPLIWFYGTAQSQTSHETSNHTQLALTNSLALSLVAMGVLLIVYAARKRISGWLIVSAAAH